MSHILLKSVPNSTITAPVSTEYFKFFCNKEQNNELYYMDNTGSQYPVGNTIKYIEVTYEQLYELGCAGSFVTGSYYFITNFESRYEQPDYYCDGSLKTSVTTKGKPSGYAYQPILIAAISSKDLAEYAYQPAYVGGYYQGYEKDIIKYDYTWNETEFVGHSARGRIIERIDEFGNKTDYDHRTIQFKRYQRYDKKTLLEGIIKDYNSVTGLVTAVGASFSYQLNAGEVIIIDSSNDLGYDIGLKVAIIKNDNEIIVDVDSLIGAAPSTITLNNGAQIIPVDYNFIGRSYNFYDTTATGIYDQYKENYFGQSDDADYIESFTFNYLSVITNNIIGNYSNLFLQEKPNGVLILSNNVFESETINNKIGYYSYNNHISSVFNDNNIGNYFDNNVILDIFEDNNIGNNYIGNFIQWDFINNRILNDFYNNNISNIDKPLVKFEKNIIGNDFHDNTIRNSFLYNNIDNDFYGNTSISSFYQNKIASKFYNNYISKDFLYNVIDLDFYINNINGEFQYNLINAKFYSNEIKYNFMQNKIYCNFSQNITNNGKDKLGFIYNIISYDVSGQDFSNSTHVCEDYTCNIVKSKDSNLYIFYFDGSSWQKDHIFS